jgi:hypothetical protein
MYSGARPFACAISTPIATILVGMILSTPARADVLYSYASVVCKDNRALLRFTFAYNNEQPDFGKSGSSDDPSPIGADLETLSADDPSHCKLGDGREILLKQADLGDAAAYGQCGADTTETFSLWIGKDKIYSREVWHHKCGWPFEIRAIALDASELIECRATSEGLSDDHPAVTCTDQSERLRHPIVDKDAPGKVVLIRSAANTEAFCRSLVKLRAPEQFGPSPPPYATWPTRQRDGIEEVEPIAVAHAELIDLNNDGRLDRVVSWSGDGSGPNGNETVWALLPQGASETVVAELEKELQFAGEEKLTALRKAGMIVFAGDQTAYRSVGAVHLTPFRRDGTTWMHATIIRGIGTLNEPTDLVLRPTPAGDLDEICVFRATPPL